MNNYQLDHAKKFMDIERIFSVHQITEKDEKLKYIQICDSAYTFSVVQRDDFLELFDKIHYNAIFLGMKYASEYVGYAAIYANDFENYSAYITLICISDKYQRLHLGSMLLKECVDAAQKAGMRDIRLEVLKQDQGAIQFYEKNKFEYEKEASLKSIYMRKLI